MSWSREPHLCEIKQHQKPSQKTNVIDREKRSKPQNEVKPFENIKKNLRSILKISPVQKDVLPSRKPQDHFYEWQNPFRLKENNPSQRNCQNQLSNLCLYHIEKERQQSLIQGKIYIQWNSKEDLEYW